MRQSDWKIIRALPLFRDMTETNFDELVSAAFLQRFPQHVTLINEGSMPDFLHIVVEGSVELYGIHDRHETTLDIVRPVSTFILAAVYFLLGYLVYGTLMAAAGLAVAADMQGRRFLHPKSGRASPAPQ